MAPCVKRGVCDCLIGKVHRPRDQGINKGSGSIVQVQVGTATDVKCEMNIISPIVFFDEMFPIEIDVGLMTDQLT